MRTIIAGCRDLTDYSVLEKAMEHCPWKPTSIVSGKAKGADELGEQYAKLHDLQITPVPADWSVGRGAGPARNLKMAKMSQALIALWDGESKGTKNMIEQAKKCKLRVLVYNFKTDKAYNY